VLSRSALQPLTSALLEAVTPIAVVTAVVIVVLRHSGRRRLSPLSCNAGDEYLDIVALAAMPTRCYALGAVPLSAPCRFSDAVREQTALFSATRAELEARYPAMFQQGPMHSVKASASLPLVARGRPFGGLHLSFPTEREAFTEADLRLSRGTCPPVFARFGSRYVASRARGCPRPSRIPFTGERATRGVAGLPNHS
jgi:GAF domain-containing protein